MHRLRTMHLFAGIGGGILADILLGHQPICAVEIDNYCQKVLAQRQKDRLLPWFPIFDDVQTFDGKPWRGLVDIVAGGFPCQDISAAGKGAGIEGEKSGLWVEMARIIGEVRPRHVFVENSPVLTLRGLGRVLEDLAAMGYDARWGVIGANQVGAPHLRKRIWIVAYPNMFGLQGSIDYSASKTPISWGDITRMACKVQRGERNCIPESWIFRKTTRMANAVDRIKAIGNGQVPQVAVKAWRTLTNSD